MSEWRHFSVGELCSRITSGGTPSRGRPEYYTMNGGHLWVKSAELLDCVIRGTDERISDLGLKNSSAKLLPSDTVLMAMYGANVGQMGMLGREAALNQAICGMIAKEEAVLPRFLFYSLLCHRARLVAQAKGAAQQNISATLIRNFEIPVPENLETQQQIAGILGAYDDLIEVNRRRVAVLEDMARGLFEEWFVRLRFPDHESVPLHNTPDGPLPEGWRFASLSDVAAINTASLKPAKAPEEIGYIDIASVSPGQIDAVNWMFFAEAPGRARRIVKDGSILWSNVRPNRRSHALVLNPAENTIASTGFTVLDAVATSFAYLYHWVTTDAFVGYLVGNAGGAAYPAVTAATFERATVLMPDAKLIERFTAFAVPLLRQAETLRAANQRLAVSRDLLLPRLMSGGLSVAEAQKELEIA